MRPWGESAASTLFSLSVCIRMATEQQMRQMWASYREINCRLWILRALRDHVELQEGEAYSASLQAEAEMRVLGIRISDLDSELEEANERIQSALQDRETDPQFERRMGRARTMLHRVRRDMTSVCEEARILNDTRNRLCVEEEFMDDTGFTLSMAIRKLKSDLADLLSAACTNA